MPFSDDEAVHPPARRPEDFRYHGPDERREDAGDLVIDRDIPVPMRDGVVIRADLYRPAGAERDCRPWWCGALMASTAP